MNNEYDPEILTLNDETGKEYSFEVLDAVETDTGRYVALLPVYDNPEQLVEERADLIVLKEMEENGENFFEEIDDDDEYETVAEMFVDRLSDAFEIDEE